MLLYLSYAASLTKMKLNRENKKCLDFKINKSKEGIWKTAKENIKNYQWTDFLLTNKVDYREFVLDDQKIEVTRISTFFSPFRSYGKIIFKIDEEKGSLLKCEIIPYNNNYNYIVLAIFTFLILWTLVGLLLNSIQNSIIIIFFGWTISILFVFFKYRFDKNNLIKYTKLIVKDLTAD